MRCEFCKIEITGPSDFEAFLELARHTSRTHAGETLMARSAGEQLDYWLADTVDAGKDPVDEIRDMHSPDEKEE